MTMPTEHQIDEFVNMLKAHDWFYDYSDDHQAWTSGRQQANKIAGKALSHEVYDRIYQMWVETVQKRDKFTDPVTYRKDFVDGVKASLIPATA